MKKVMLYSGGLDSWLIDKIWKPDIKLYIDLYTEYSEEEKDRLDDDTIVLDFPGINQFVLDGGVLPLRNLYLLMIACNYTDFDDVEICLGATAGDYLYNDKSYLFAEKSEDILNTVYNVGMFNHPDKEVKINFSFLEYTKYDLLKQYLEQGGDLETAFRRSFTCQHPSDNEPCWNCKYCFLKFVPFYLCNYPFPDSVIESMKKFLVEDALPKIRKNKSYYGKELINVLEVAERLGVL